MVVCKLPILLAERKMRVADLIRGTGINKTTLHKLWSEILEFYSKDSTPKSKSST